MDVVITELDRDSRKAARKVLDNTSNTAIDHRFVVANCQIPFFTPSNASCCINRFMNIGAEKLGTLREMRSCGCQSYAAGCAFKQGISQYSLDIFYLPT